MESFFTRFKNVLVLVAILLAQTIGLAVQVRRPVESGAPDGSNVTLLRYWTVSAVTPFERFFHGFGYNVRHGWSNYIDLRNTRQQNRDLQEQIARLRLEQAALSEDAIQGHRLQALLDFQQHYVASTVAAQVIGTSGNDLSKVLYIDKGSKDEVYAAETSTPSFARASLAASCSAAFFDSPWPTPNCSPSMTAADVKRRSWGGPSTSSTE